MKKLLFNLSAILIFFSIFNINSVSAKPIELEDNGGSGTTNFANFDVRIISDVTAEDLDDDLGGVLKGKGSAFIDAGKANGIDPAFLAALSMHETGNGTSDLSKSPFNNVGGITCGSYSNCGTIVSGGTKWRIFSSVDDSIKYKAELLKNNYVDQGLYTVSQIQTKYAPTGAANDPKNLNSNWISGISKFMNGFGVTNNNGSGDISEGSTTYENGQYVGSILKKYGFDKGEININNIGIDDRKTKSSKMNEYGIYSFGSKIGLFLFRVAQFVSIFLLGFIMLLWLLAALAYSGLYFANEWLSKLTFNKIDVLQNGFSKLGIISGFAFLAIVIIISGLLPKIFALIYSMLAQFIEFLSRISFV